MKKSVKIAVLAVFAFVVGINVYKSQTDMSLSDIQLDNVEALASFDPITSTHTCVPDGQYCILYLNGKVVFQSFQYKGEN